LGKGRRPPKGESFGDCQMAAGNRGSASLPLSPCFGGSKRGARAGFPTGQAYFTLARRSARRDFLRLATALWTTPLLAALS